MSKEDWKNGESTRSGLLWEVERILKELPKEELPDILLMENVPQVHSEQNANDFMAWQDFLNSKGYFNFIADMNAKDYGIPQNRERCFMVSILSDDFISYEFPKPIKLEKKMKDFLEEKVDEKFYIENEKTEKLIKQLFEEYGGGRPGLGLLSVQRVWLQKAMNPTVGFLILEVRFWLEITKVLLIL